MALTRRKERRPIVLGIVAVAIIASLLQARDAAGAYCLRGAPRFTRRQCSGLVNRRPNADVGSAAGEGSVHGGVDILISRLMSLSQERRRGHHLSRLAVATLRHVKIRPCKLDRMRTVPRKPFDRCDLSVIGGPHPRLARAHRAAADVHRTSAALAYTAAIFRAAKIQYIPNDPKKRHVRGSIHRGRP